MASAEDIVSFEKIGQAITLFKHVVPITAEDGLHFKLRNLDLNKTELAIMDACFRCVNNKISCIAGEGDEVIARIEPGGRDTLPTFAASREMQIIRQNLKQTIHPEEFDYLDLDAPTITRISEQLNRGHGELSVIDC